MTQLSSLTVFSYTARATFVSEMCFIIMKRSNPRKTYLNAGKRCVCQDIALLHSRKGGTRLCQARSPLSGCLAREKGQKGRRCVARRPCPGPAELPANAPAPAGRAVPCHGAGPPRHGPEAGGAPRTTHRRRCGAAVPARRAQVPSALRGSGRAAAAALSVISPGHWEGGWAVGPPQGRARGGGGPTGPAQPGPAHAALRLKCRTQGSLVGM